LDTFFTKICYVYTVTEKREESIWKLETANKKFIDQREAQEEV